MDPALASLLAASLAFVGTHFALSHPLRRPLVARIGQRGFLGFYSLVALATLGWVIFAFRAAPPADLPGSGQVGWIIATLLTLPALVLFLGSLAKNPALPNPGPAKPIERAPTGVFAITRHPMMWGFALWAIAHIVLWWSNRTLIVASAILVLALVGAHLQDRKKETLMGDSWSGWEARTSYWPRWSGLLTVSAVLWLVTLALWLLITWAHIRSAGVPAGIWRWLG
ncbi:NnrU protein [Tsuneonella deserti]|uniref:NnrU protein n=1 Tax=Tsuneonella deserti TaxID=2035528 RepID=A0ABQ1SCH9_9SPHN|nr:NnrU family protein [Tsuneonella deserti]GGE04699.1 NnrU protein [Tsuneonella deserti]